MPTRFTRTLKRSLLSALVLTAIVVPQIQANAQVARSQRLTTSIQLAQTQSIQNAVVAVESVGMTVSDMDRAVAFYSIEFLEYLSPKDGRSLPTDAKPNDLLHWQTTLVVKDVEAIADRLRLNQSTFISPRVVAMPQQTLGFKKGFLVRDPDGHTLRLVEKPGIPKFGSAIL